MYPTWNQKYSEEKSEQLSKKSFNYLIDSDYLVNHQRSKGKESWGNSTVHKFHQGIQLHIQRGKIEQFLLVYGLPKETVSIIMMLYRNTKATVCSSDEDTSFFGIVTSVLQGDKAAPYLFIFCLDYVLRMSITLIKEDGFTLKRKARSIWYPTETITNAHYADDLALFTNAPAKAESILQSIKQAVRSIDLYLNTYKTEYIHLKQKGTISNLSGKPLKLVDQFTYLSSNISSTVNDVTIWIVKTSNAIDHMKVCFIW